MKIAYQIENLTKVYKGSTKKATDHLSLEIHEGEIFGLLGPNGAGKSTLVNQMAGLVKPTSGSLCLFGKDVLKNPAWLTHSVSLQAQSSFAFRDLYPEEVITYTARLRGMPSREARLQTQLLIEELGLTAYRKVMIGKLSGGIQRLVNLAITFIGKRPVQIFDEPTNDLDPSVRRMVWDKLFALNRQGITIIVVTHNVIEAERIFQRVGIVNHGRLLALGTLGELKERIDKRIRLELLFKDQAPICDELLATFGETHPLTSQLRVILCQRDRIREVIDHVFEHVGMEKLDDFRILTPSLEDVYLQLGGGSRLGQ